jgi:Fe-S-cluster containining protein
MKPIDHVVKAAKAYEARVVIPHCTSCTKSCCTLETVVLDMTWKQAQHLYQIRGTKQAFAQALLDETTPHSKHLKESHGTFYAHGAPCPGYDLEEKNCTVYGTPHKPHACSEFPIYGDGDALTVNLRCEAVNLDALAAELRAVNPRVRHRANEQFPFLITFDIAR